MSTVKVFQEILKLRGIQEIHSAGLITFYIYFVNYFAYQPYRWDAEQNQLTTTNRIRTERAASTKLAFWMHMLVYGAAILFILSPVILIKKGEYEKTIIHILVAGLITAILFLVIFHERTSSEFCQFTNSMMKFTSTDFRNVSRGKHACKISFHHLTKNIFQKRYK